MATALEVKKHRLAQRASVANSVGVKDDEDRLLAEFARTRDPALLEQLVERFMPLAKKLAGRYGGGAETYEDLLQVASIGLVNAITRFDPDRGFTFATFAVPTILGEMRRHFRDRGWSIRVPRDLQERNLRVENAIAELPTRLGRPPSIAEVSKHLDLTDEEVLEAMEVGAAHHARSLDALPVDGDDERPPLADMIGADEPGYETVEYGAAIAPVLDALSDRERLILHLRFVEDRTQSEIAREIGVSQMHVSRILRATLSRLRTQVAGTDES